MDIRYFGIFSVNAKCFTHITRKCNLNKYLKDLFVRENLLFEINYVTEKLTFDLKHNSPGIAL